MMLEGSMELSGCTVNLLEAQYKAPKRRPQFFSSTFLLAQQEAASIARGGCRHGLLWQVMWGEWSCAELNMRKGPCLCFCHARKPSAHQRLSSGIIRERGFKGEPGGNMQNQDHFSIPLKLSNCAYNLCMYCLPRCHYHSNKRMCAGSSDLPSEVLQQ